MDHLPSYHYFKNALSASPDHLSFVSKNRKTIRAILNGTDTRLLLIMGPCSIHDSALAKDYALKFKELEEKVSSNFFLVMRTYFEKPRTSSGWKGFLYDPHLDGSHQIHQGIEQSRRLLLDLAEMGIPTATEFLDPLTAFYYDDLISWGSIGARTSSSQPHRQLASALNMPVGFKNGVAGNISAAVNGVKVASNPQTFIGLNETGQTIIARSRGNLDCHIILRGGDLQPNYDPISVGKALSYLEKDDLGQRLLIDCSHQNSGKQHEKQVEVCHSVLQQVANGNSAIKGLMLESHLQAGNQDTRDLNALQYGVSITDACLDWTTTERLVLYAADYLQSHTALR